MNILIIIFSILGLLKLVSLIVSLMISIVFSIKNEPIEGVKRVDCFTSIDECYLIPTIRIRHSTKYLEVIAHFLWFEYYSSYNIDKVE